MARLNHKDISLEVDDTSSQLLSLQYKGKELFHPGCSQSYQGKGWKNSEIACFPIFGPVDNQQLILGSKQFSLEQHGISRYLPFSLYKKTPTSLTYIQEYDGANIPNPKADGASHPPFLSWFPYCLTKTFSLDDNVLRCQFHLENTSSHSFPYNFAWHPAFLKQEDISFHTPEQMYSLAEVVTASNRFTGANLRLEGLQSLRVTSQDCGFDLRTKGFSHLVLWSPSLDANMFCVEQLASLPDPEQKMVSISPLTLVGGDVASFEVSLHPFLMNSLQ